MLDRASIAEVKTEKVSKSHGYLVVAMRLYPRFLPKILIDEYANSLSPDAALFGRYREFKKHSGHQNQAFQLAGYEQDFALSKEGMTHLARLASASDGQNVFLICQCDRSEFCHVDLMLLIAEKHFKARIGKLPYDYPDFRKRF
ncbi:hypothetical protein WDW37_19200 [Bdellovibrionota bacterium FG-1]